MSEPITPEAARKAHTDSLRDIPDEVLDAINQLIVENMLPGRTTYSTFTVDDVVKRIQALGYSRDTIDNNGWLDFEPLYREAGWNVVYDQPGYNESYDATYTFRVPR